MMLAVALVLLSGVSLDVAHAQSGEPLSLYRTYFVPGDYVVGAVDLRGLGDSSGFATRKISIPDGVQPNATQVPDGADIVAAFLYWETVESSQAPLVGQHGFFNGFAVTGTHLGNPNAPVSWSSGGCSGSSNGSKTLSTYRADVRPYLNFDSSGRVIGNGSYNVSLPDSGSNGGGVPLTLGATLIIIYRVPSPAVPLNSIVIYDGAYAPVNQAQTMIQDISGFYDAANVPVSKITHVVGNGQANKGEAVYLNGINLPSLYPGLPPFPGIYNYPNGSWDSPTWFPNATQGAVTARSATANTSVVPSSSNSGCVVWGVVIFSTTVQDSDGDGLLDKWEANQGYTDVNTGRWVPLPGADPYTKDVYVNLNYLTNLDGSAGTYIHSHLPKQAAIDKVGNAFANAPVDCVNGSCKGVHVHFDLGNVYQGDPYVISDTANNAVPESSLQCLDSASALCQFPGQVAVGWKSGLLYLENAALSPNTTPTIGYFDPARKDSYHYVLFGHALGSPRSYWTAYGAAAQNPSMAQLLSITVSNNSATVTLQSPAGILKPGDPVSPGVPGYGDMNLDRITIGGAIFQPSLNGVYRFSNLTTSTTNSISTTSFTIPTTAVPNGMYTYSNEPRLAVLFAGPGSSSGHSDVGGADSLITFGLWSADDPPTGCQPNPAALQPGQSYCNNQVGNVQSQAGTLMHEIGHSFGLTHGGTYYLNAQNNPSTPPTYGTNCKPNYESVMNYLFQVRGFPDGAIDYSRQTLSNLNESALDEISGIGVDSVTRKPALHPTRWFAPPNAFDKMLGGRLATMHCDGTPLAPGEQGEVRVDGSSPPSYVDWNNDLVQDPVTSPIDVNFDGQIGTSQYPFFGFNDWQNTDFRQIGSRGNAGGFSAGGVIPDLIGGGAIGDLIGGGTPGDLIGGGVIGDLIGGGTPGDLIGGGAIGDLIGGGTEEDFTIANSTVDAPANLIAAMGSKSVVLNWSAPGFGQIRSYQIYRLLGAFDPVLNPLTNARSIATVTGAPPATTYTDTTAKNNTTYTYYVIAALGDGRQSTVSNGYPISVKF